MADRDLADRCNRFSVELSLAACEVPGTHEWGHSVLTPSIPLVWDANNLLITDASLGADRIADLADEILGGAGLSHRSVDILDAEAGRRLAPDFEARGWEAEPSIAMVLEGEPVPGANPPEVTERPLEDIHDLRRAMIGGVETAPEGTARAALIEQLLEWDRLLGVVAGNRWFTADHAGAPASACRLYGRGDVGQVEDVGTLASARENGLGRAVTVGAARASLERGDTMTFITALANDWPKLIYDKIGFREIGGVWTFRRKP